MGAGIPGYSGGPVSADGVKWFGCLMTLICLAFIGVMFYLAFHLEWRTEATIEVAKLAACFMLTLLTSGYLIWRGMG